MQARRRCRGRHASLPQLAEVGGHGFRPRPQAASTPQAQDAVMAAEEELRQRGAREASGRFAVA